jgi:hypothetical protein
MGQVLDDDGGLIPRGLGGTGTPPPPGDLTLPGSLGTVASESEAAGIDFELEMLRRALDRIQGAAPSDAPVQAPGSGPTGLLTASVQVGEIASGDAAGATAGVDECIDGDDEDCEER